MPERVIKTLDGKRGSFLFVGGIAYFFIGLSYIIASTPSRAAAFSWLPNAVTPESLGWVWTIGGIGVAVAALVSRRYRDLEPFAFGVLMLCPVLFVVIFLVATLIGVHPNGWISSGVYGLLSTWVWIAAGWENPRPVQAVARQLKRGGDE